MTEEDARWCLGEFPFRLQFSVTVSATLIRPTTTVALKMGVTYHTNPTGNFLERFFNFYFHFLISFANSDLFHFYPFFNLSIYLVVIILLLNSRTSHSGEFWVISMECRFPGRPSELRHPKLVIR